MGAIQQVGDSFSMVGSSYSTLTDPSHGSGAADPFTAGIQSGLAGAAHLLGHGDFVDGMTGDELSMQDGELTVRDLTHDESVQDVFNGSAALGELVAGAGLSRSLLKKLGKFGKPGKAIRIGVEIGKKGIGKAIAEFLEKVDVKKMIKEKKTHVTVKTKCGKTIEIRTEQVKNFQELDARQKRKVIEELDKAKDEAEINNVIDKRLGGLARPLSPAEIEAFKEFFNKPKPGIHQPGAFPKDYSTPWYPGDLFPNNKVLGDYPGLYTGPFPDIDPRPN
jgi:hypothetical protein